MNLFDALILGIVQGLTEFLPVSSSGHLVLGESLLNLRVETLKSFDILVHSGSLLALLIYFRKDIQLLIRGFMAIFHKADAEESLSRREILYILIATIPATIIGLGFEDQIDAFFRSPGKVAIAMIAVALYFITAEEFKKRQKKSEPNNFWTALFVGISQAIAIIPGISRSGSTIATGMICNLSRVDAARFSFLIGIPAIGGATLITLVKNYHMLLEPSNLLIHLTGLIASFVTSLWAVSFLMRFLKRNTLHVFAVYLVILGILLIIFG